MPFSPDQEEQSPSHGRRLALRQADAGNTIRVLDSYPISNYFDIALRLLDAFQKAVDERRLDEAYVYGLRFAAFGVESLPRHKDWKLRSYSKQKRRNAQQVDKVLSMMETIKQRMDAEELVRQQERMRLQKQREEEDRKRREEAQRKRMEEEQRQAQEKRQEAQSKKNIEQSAMAKLQLMGSSIRAERAKTVVEKPQVEVPSVKPDSSLEEKKTEPVASKSSDQASLDLAGTLAVPTGDATAVTRESSPRSSKEQTTIHTLDRAIQANNKRLDKIENREIPNLLKAAKDHLHHGKGSSRKAALQCLARKKALQKQADVMKAANFNMETQIFMLENAMEDRQVEEMLQEAAQAMKTLNENAGVPAIDLSDAAANITLDLFGEEDEEELLEELRKWISPPAEGEVQTKEGDDVSILSLPTIPASVSSASTPSKKEETSSTRKLLKAVLG